MLPTVLPTRYPLLSPLAPPLGQALNEVINTIAHGAAAAGSAGAMSAAQQAEVLQLLLSASGESEEECRAGGGWEGALEGRVWRSSQCSACLPACLAG